METKSGSRLLKRHQGCVRSVRGFQGWKSEGGGKAPKSQRKKWGGSEAADLLSEW